MSRTTGFKTTSGSDRGELTINGTTVLTFAADNIRVPKGTTSDRPGSPESGMIRFNTNSNKFEGYDGTSWVNLH